MYIMGLGNAPAGECMFTGRKGGGGTLHTHYYTGGGGTILNVSSEGSGVGGGSLEDRINQLEDRQLRIMNLLSEIASALDSMTGWMSDVDSDTGCDSSGAQSAISTYTSDGDLGAIPAEIAASQASKKSKLLW